MPRSEGDERFAYEVDRLRIEEGANRRLRQECDSLNAAVEQLAGDLRASAEDYGDAKERIAELEGEIVALKKAADRPKSQCVIGEYCHRHGFIHGAEAEELRCRLAKLTRKDVDRVLEDVDARDSLAWLEHVGREQGRQ